MPYANLVVIMGHLGRDPESREAGSGTVCRFSVATTRRWTAKDGEKKEETCWHNCTAWGKPGEVIQKYSHKGDLIYVQGRINNWVREQDDGTKKYGSEIIVNEFQLGPKKQSPGSSPATPDNPAGDDDLPFYPRTTNHTAPV